MLLNSYLKALRKIFPTFVIDHKKYILKWVKLIYRVLMYIDIRYILLSMIRNFKNKAAQDIFDGMTSASARKIPIILHEKIRRIFDQLNAATQVETLRIPPGNKLEKLKGNLKNYWSIRINIQWRVIFIWKDNEAYDVEIIDYH